MARNRSVHGTIGAHDRRDRLLRPNPGRQVTVKARVPLVGVIGELVAAMSHLLDTRIAFRLPFLVAGAMLASGRRMAASWFRAAGVGEDWDRFNDCLQSVGKNVRVLL